MHFNQQVQLQKELSDLQSELEMKKKELKQCKEDNKILSQKKGKADTILSDQLVMDITEQGTASYIIVIIELPINIPHL